MFAAMTTRDEKTVAAREDASPSALRRLLEGFRERRHKRELDRMKKHLAWTERQRGVGQTGRRPR